MCRNVAYPRRKTGRADNVAGDFMVYHIVLRTHREHNRWLELPDQRYDFHQRGTIIGHENIITAYTMVICVK